MNNKWFIALAVVFFAQLFVPAQMILEREDILENGKEFRFKTAPIDPADPFRGRYIYLSFEIEEIKVKNFSAWKDLQTVYVSLAQDEKGFAKIVGLSETARPNSVKATIGWIDADGRMRIQFPFERFYMDEFKAPTAEKLYIRANRANPNSICYAQVFVKQGEAAVNDVFIDGKSLRQIAAGQPKAN